MGNGTDMGAGKRSPGRVAGLRARQRRKSEDRFRERFAQHWSEIRAERRGELDAPPIVTGPSNFTRAEVPWSVDLAAAWSWRLVVIAAAALGVGWLISYFSVVVMPLVIALLVAALSAPLVDWAGRRGINRKVASIVVVVGGLALVSALLTFVGQQVAQGASDLAEQVVTGLDEIRDWLRTGPLQASDSQISDALAQAGELISTGNEQLVTRVTELGTAIGHIVAGFFIVLFAAYFFLADGARIWSWVVRLFPRAARGRADSSGRVAWRSVGQFVRGTVLVATADAIGIVTVALILNVPFAPAIGVLVFLGAFIPLVGATLSGSVAVLVALVAQGPLVALLMFGGVILVQQIEAHILQPFLLGKFVSVHPLGVIVAIAVGIVIAGIAGALVAVPLAAALNAVAQHLAGYTEPEASAEVPAGPGP